MILSVKTYLLVAFWWLKSLNDDKLTRRIQQQHLCGESIKLPWKRRKKERKERKNKGRKERMQLTAITVTCSVVTSDNVTGMLKGRLRFWPSGRYRQLHLGSHKPLWLLSLRCAPIILSHSIQRLSAGDDWRSSSPAGCNRLYKPCRVPPARSTGMCNHKSR